MSIREKDPVKELYEDHIQALWEYHNLAACNLPNRDFYCSVTPQEKTINVTEIGPFIDETSLETLDDKPLTGTGAAKKIKDLEQDRLPIITDILINYFDYDINAPIGHHADRINGKLVDQYLINFDFNGTAFTTVVINAYGHAIYIMDGDEYKIGMSKSEMRQHGARRIYWTFGEHETNDNFENIESGTDNENNPNQVSDDTIKTTNEENKNEKTKEEREQEIYNSLRLRIEKAIKNIVNDKTNKKNPEATL